MAIQVSFHGYVRKSEEKEIKGEKMVILSVAIKPFKKGDKSTWRRVELWKQKANYFSQYGQIGNRCFVSGEEADESYIDKNGLERRNPKVRVNTFELLNDRPNSDAPQQTTKSIIEDEWKDAGTPKDINWGE